MGFWVLAWNCIKVHQIRLDRTTKGLNFKLCLISPKIYESKTERYPVAFFLLFKSKCPFELRNTSHFYLTVVDAPLTDCWYKNQSMGVNTTNTMLRRMKKNQH